MAGDEKDRRGIQSIEVGGELLQALARVGEPMSLGALAREAGMTPPKAHPYLVSFGKLGLVEQDPATGRYGLGPFALRMGLVALHGLDAMRVVTPMVARLADELRLNVAVAVWGNHGPTIVLIEETGGQIHMNMRPGTVMMPLMGSATGRLFAAFLPARTTADLLAAEGADRDNPTLAEIRQHGLARALGNPIPGINAFSAPVYNSSGALSLALTALGTVDSFDPGWNGPVARTLRRYAAEASDRLGCPHGLVDDQGAAAAGRAPAPL